MIFFLTEPSHITVFPGGSAGTESACISGNPVFVTKPEDPLEKEMATHASILVWEISWTEEPGRP